MSLFGQIRGMLAGSGREILPLWNIPETTEEIDSILLNQEKPQLIYKHSFSCGISIFAKSSLESDIEQLSRYADLHFVDVKLTRSISNYIAEKTNVIHESPQALVLNKGHVFASFSHGEVRHTKVIETLKEI